MRKASGQTDSKPFGADPIPRWDDDANRKTIENHLRWIEGLKARVAEARTFRDLKRAIARLSEAIPAGGPGRPSSPRVNDARLRALRTEAGLSQLALAEFAGVNVKTLRAYEHSQPGDGANLKAITDALNRRLKRDMDVEDITL